MYKIYVQRGEKSVEVPCAHEWKTLEQVGKPESSFAPLHLELIEYCRVPFSSLLDHGDCSLSFGEI